MLSSLKIIYLQCKCYDLDMTFVHNYFQDAKGILISIFTYAKERVPEKSSVTSMICNHT